ncbi:MAG: hypothetical protein E7473_09435 [Ruminococcaceae bacterium]|nr:hypothetical protein [Oscillospiraceae bacterium]
MTASLYYFAKCDDSISKEEEELLKVYVSAIIYNPNLSVEAAGDLIEIKNKEISFADVKEYLDAVKNEDLTEIKKLIQSVIIASEGINQDEREAFSRFIKYYNQRLKV